MLVGPGSVCQNMQIVINVLFKILESHEFKDLFVGLILALKGLAWKGLNLILKGEWKGVS